MLIVLATLACKHRPAKSWRMNVTGMGIQIPLTQRALWGSSAGVQRNEVATWFMSASNCRYIQRKSNGSPSCQATYCRSRALPYYRWQLANEGRNFSQP